MQETASLYVQYGCGLSAPDGWMSFDASPTLRAQRLWLLGRIAPGPRFPRAARYGDIVRGLPVQAGSCAAVYCSHVLEHLALDDMRRALRNTLVLLRPGGAFRLVLPDLERAIMEYAERRGAPNAAPAFLRDTLLGEPSRPRGLMGAARAWIGNSKHLWMWDYPALAHELAEAGFTDIRRAARGDSGDPMFDRIEDPQRWEGQLGIQCAAPGPPR